jgi:general secretion pathway protein D
LGSSGWERRPREKVRSNHRGLWNAAKTIFCYRRIALKASVHLLTGCVALGLALPTSLSRAAAPLAGSLAVTNASIGQFGGKSENRREADDLLKRARQAMKEGKFDQAGDLIAKADKLGVKYSALTDRWADTPEKLRKALAEAKTEQPQRPSSRFPSTLGKNETQPQVPASPFSGQNPEGALDRITDESKAKALSYADQGRKALDRGDVPGAKAFYQRAIAHQATFGPSEYSPQKLGAELSAAGVEISQLRPASSAPTPGLVQRPPDATPGPAERIPSFGTTRLPTAGGEETVNPYQQPADNNPLTRPAEASIYGAPSAGATAATPPRGNGNSPIRQASGNVTDDAPLGYPVARGAYNPATDKSRNVPASNSQGEDTSRLTPAGPQSPGVALYQEGIKALESRDRVTALAKFNQAWKYQAQLDPDTRMLLKGKLQDLSGPVGRPASAGAEGKPSPLEQVHSEQEILRQKLVREITTEQKAAEKLAITDPKGALQNLKKVREKITAAEVEPAARKGLLTLVDRSISELSNWIEANKATLDNKEHNEQVRGDVARDREATVEMQTKLGQLVEQFNSLIDERRYAEAEIIAKQANEIAPQNPVTALLVEKSKFAKQIAFNEDNKARKEAGYIGAYNAIEESSQPWDDRESIKWMEVTKWEQISKMRSRMLGDLRKLTPQEMEIQKALGKQVEVKFEGETLSQVMDTLSKMTGVNIHLNQNALHSEGITSDTPVSLNLTQPVSLKSALTLILEPMQLGYAVRNEVLDVVSKNSKDANTYAQVYYVADLVIPIPNFVPSYNMGLPGALRESLNSLGYGPGGMAAGSMVAGSGRAASQTVAMNDQQNQAPQTVNPLVLAQQAGITAPSQGGRASVPIGGPGGMGGGVIADFDSLIDLITTTIDPDSWEDVGGPGTIAEFATNLSLVISQTQEVHDKIDRLLTQLREIQDEQVTIEVRFITLSDRFFERIGIDFDFNIDDNSGLNAIADILVPARGERDDGGPSVAFGLTPNGTPTPTLDLEFKQGSFASTRPQFGSFDPNTAATFGFAILSDIEAFFLLEAAQGDDRTNVLQAPKVTLFNGQTAFVSDTSQRPFVISVIPVVGDFAAAHQPVIVVLNEGTSLSVQAVISADRRFCRLTLVPFFSRIGDVETFTFNGKVTTNTGTTVQDPTDAKKTVTNGGSRTVEGTTVQLPTFAFTSVVTTVSVPDGGTVLLGGIKRLREGRNERGVPMLSKVPYISRLFRNVGIGRDAQSLMMMVTPRIIIQKEEEAKLGFSSNTP